jgi:hypothetical protein
MVLHLVKQGRSDPEIGVALGGYTRREVQYFRARHGIGSGIGKAAAGAGSAAPAKPKPPVKTEADYAGQRYDDIRPPASDATPFHGRPHPVTQGSKDWRRSA